MPAVSAFAGELAPASWPALALAVLAYLARLACTTRAWRNIVALAYPEARVPWRGMFGATTAGMAVSTVVPAKGGELLRLYLARRTIPGSSYPTLAATLVVETVFPFAAALGFLIAALQTGALPGIRFAPSIDPAAWVGGHPVLTAAIGVAVVAASTALAVSQGDRLAAIARRLAQGFAALGNWRVYVRRVAVWQALDWTLRIAALYCFLAAFGVTASFDNAFSVQVAQNTSALLPLTPSGLGTEQALIAASLADDGLPAAEAVGFSVGMKLALVSVNVAVGLTALALMARTLRWRRLLALERAGAGRPPRGPSDA